MEFDEAAKILEGSTRSELRDHAFGDREVFWEKDGNEVAYGYFGAGYESVTIKTGTPVQQYPHFVGEAARKLGELGTLGEVGRNDETGPEEFIEGEVQPGLSIGDVFHELTGQYQDGS